MSPLVVFEGQEVVVALLAHQATENPRFMRLLVVQERAGVSVAPPTLVALVRLVALVDHGLTGPAPAPPAPAVSSRHALGSVQTLLAQRAGPILAGTQVGDEVVAVGEEHAAVHANVAASIHLVGAVSRGPGGALLLAVWPLRPVDQLVVEKVLLA